MNENRITFEDVMALRPCISESQIMDYFNKRESVTYLDVVRDKKIEHSHKLWLLCHYLSDKNKMLFAIKCALEVLPLFEKIKPDDERPRIALEKAQMFLNGECEKGVVIAAAKDAFSACKDTGHVFDAAYSSYYAAYTSYSPRTLNAVYAAIFAFYSVKFQTIACGIVKKQLDELKGLLDGQKYLDGKCKKEPGCKDMKKEKLRQLIKSLDEVNTEAEVVKQE